MNIGANTFGLRELLYKDFEQGLADLKNAGLDTLEVCVAFPSNPDAMPDFPISPDADVLAGGIFPLEEASERIKKVRSAGLKVIGIHPMCFFNDPQELIDLVPLMISFAKENNIKYYVNSPMKDAAALSGFLPMYKEISERLSAEGIDFMIHNHEYEVKVMNGESGLDLVLNNSPLLKVELDVGWALFGGADPVELMERYKNQLGIIHLKDVCKGACAENKATCCTAVGEGSIPLGDIIKKAYELGLGSDCLVIDQDESSGDIFDDIKVGISNINKYLSE